MLKFGPCDLQVPKKSVSKVLMSEVLNPFYIFQIVAVIFWYWDGYFYYAACILIISIGSVLLSLYETIKNHNEIRRMAHYTCTVQRMITNKQVE